MYSQRPSDKEMGILAEGFFGQQEMIQVEWINWAIELMGSDTPTVDYGTVCDLVSYYGHCKLLQAACRKYIAMREHPLKC